MKYIKLFEDYNHIKFHNDLLLDAGDAHDYLVSINFYDDHGYDEDDFMIMDNIYNICEIYQGLKTNDVEIYRELELPTFEDLDLTQVGYFYSFEKDGVGTYDASVSNEFNKNWKEQKRQDYTITVKTNIKNINWEGTLISNAIYGDEQSECQLYKGSEIFITHINWKKLETPIKAVS